MKISYGNSRKEKKWKNNDISWEDFCRRVSTTRITAETTEEYRKLTKAQQDEIKDVGGFVGGHLKGGVRRAGHVLCRSMLTLDMDFGTPGIVDELETLMDHECCIYSTHKHLPEAPRLRLIFPLKREVTEEEYPAVARMVAKEIGIDLFDDSTYQPHRLMYWPSTSSNGEFIHKVIDGDPLDPDQYLAMYDDWHDITTWPVSSRQSEVMKKATKKQADPLTKPGIVGVFCRTYSIRDAIETFLTDVYKPSAMEGRYDYIAGESSAGVVIMDDKFSYSFHATDPACGMLLNAFDVVRVHKFADMDEKKSFQAMAEFAASLDLVKINLAEERKAEAERDFSEGEDWRTRLIYDKQGNIANSLVNEVLILTNDEELQGFAYNEMANKVQVIGKLPWDRPKDIKFWRDADTAQLKTVLDSRYAQFSTRNHDAAFAKVADDRRFHPIREYLENLPKWDETKRVETLLVDYFGADDSEYTRAVTRKCLAAAVARIMHPGIKFDSVLILNGPQGIGKSTFYSKLAGEWFSDSLSLTDMKDKAAAEKLQGYWILELGELAGMKKADIECVKSFLSRTDDDYRPSYGKVVESHPRQCIIVGSTNAENGFLRDITGNRRFWPVKVSGISEKKSWNMTEEEVRQIWAEAKVIYENGEPLMLEGDVAKIAAERQQDAMESDERLGMVESYLEMLLPENWDSMDQYGRRNYFSEKDAPTTAKGVLPRKQVSNAEIWCECFGKELADMKPADSYAIAAIMAKMPGWERTATIRKVGNYGRQRLYLRKE